MDRRRFLQQTAGALTGAAALATTARSYARIRGANDRLLLGHAGIGNRGRGLEYILSLVKDSQNVETAALCDLWTVNRERAVATATKTAATPIVSVRFMTMLRLRERKLVFSRKLRDCVRSKVGPRRAAERAGSSDFWETKKAPNSRSTIDSANPCRANSEQTGKRTRR